VLVAATAELRAQDPPAGGEDARSRSGGPADDRPWCPADRHIQARSRPPVRSRRAPRIGFARGHRHQQGRIDPRFNKGAPPAPMSFRANGFPPIYSTITPCAAATSFGRSGPLLPELYQWPCLWSFNPQVQNSHWIYPGDACACDGRPARRSAPSGCRAQVVPPQTIFATPVGRRSQRRRRLGRAGGRARKTRCS
jgi:hypothetical protein